MKKLVVFITAVMLFSCGKKEEPQVYDESIYQPPKEEKAVPQAEPSIIKGN